MVEFDHIRHDEDSLAPSVTSSTSLSSLSDGMPEEESAATVAVIGTLKIQTYNLSLDPRLRFPSYTIRSLY